MGVEVVADQRDLPGTGIILFQKLPDFFRPADARAGVAAADAPPAADRVEEQEQRWVPCRS